MSAVHTYDIRSAWQAYDSAAVRVSLDDHMLLLRERGAHKAPGENSDAGGWQGAVFLYEWNPLLCGGGHVEQLSSWSGNQLGQLRSAYLGAIESF